MQNLAEILDNLKRARVVLERTYIAFHQDDGAGGHCALGAVAVVKYGGETYAYWGVDPEVDALSETARALYPECAGRRRARPDTGFTGLFDDFEEGPIVFVNNHLGKEATLRVFDVTIAELELRLAASADSLFFLDSERYGSASPEPQMYLHKKDTAL